MNFWGGDESPDAPAAFDDAFLFERGKSVARGHKADLMNFGEVALGGHGVTGTQVSGINALPDDALNSLVGGQAVAALRWHSLSRVGKWPLTGGVSGSCLHDKNDILI